MGDPQVATEEPLRLGRDLFMVALAIFSVGLLIYEEVADPTGEAYRALLFLDWTIVIVFVVEFGYRWWQAPRKGLFLRKNWFEIPGMVPMAVGEASFLRVFRLARVARVFRLFRVIAVLSRLRRANRMASGFLRRSHLLTTLAVTVGILVGAAYAGWILERNQPETQFTSYFEALWWAIVTVTTVGYGDIVPRTLGGRIVASILLMAGVGLISVLAATFASSLIKSPTEANASTKKPLEERLADLSRLREAGHLTDEEYARAKAKVLDEPS